MYTFNLEQKNKVIELTTLIIGELNTAIRITEELGYYPFMEGTEFEVRVPREVVIPIHSDRVRRLRSLLKSPDLLLSYGEPEDVLAFIKKILDEDIICEDPVNASVIKLLFHKLDFNPETYNFN